jgi:hypothetical protein
MKKIKIDVNFDFTTDTPKFWEMYWVNEMGGSFSDPDSKSKTLKIYHKLIWSKQLPNGEFMKLVDGSGGKYLSWKNFRFGSDSIITSFRYNKYRHIIKQVIEYSVDYKSFIENYTRKSYTIGGSIIFPKTQGGINQTRGINPYIRDRFDLTLECIRKYYKNETSPLYEVLLKNKDFFDLFVDFKGYVDYFYLQDLVNKDYTCVKFWLGNGSFEKSPFPKTVDEYLLWINKQLEFVKNRNERILKSFELVKK